jgi:pimeloyl-ACP methyl ester carboxylesterase
VRRFKTWDGLEIAYREWGRASAGEAPVVLHHGFGADMAANWVAPGIVAALRAAGRAVVAVDARGHGASQKPHERERYGEDVMARDLAALVDELGAGRVDVVGYSMGAVVALLFSAGEPRVRRLVVGGVGAGVIECGGVDRRAVSNESIIAALAAEDPAHVEPREARAIRALADAIGADREALVAQAHSVYRGEIRLGEIAARTLVLAGEDDPMAVRPGELAAAIPGARLELVPGDHGMAVVQPEFAAAIVEFLGDGA